MSETQTDYVYRGSDRQTLAVKVRIDRPTGKNISWRRSSNGQAGPSGLNGAQIRDLPLYRLPELLAADPADPVVFTEGEKACEAARALGAVSVTNPGGAGQSDFGDSLAPLAGRAVYLWADNDPPGRALMDRIADRLDGIAAGVYRLDVPGLPEKGDAADFTGTAVDLADLIARAPRYRDWTAAEAWRRVADLEQELSRERAERGGGLAPPADEAVEEALLGACLYGDDVYWTVESLTADDFYSARNARIWRAIEELVWDGRPANQVTVAHHLTEQGKLDFVGNHERLDRLARETPTSMDWHVQDWARTIKQTALRRRLIALASRIAQQAHDQPDIGPVLADIYAELARIELVGKGGLRPLSQVLDAHAPAMDAFEADPRTRGGVPTGIPPVDRITTGLHRSEMTVLAARTSEGKSQMALTIALNVARSTGPVALFSLEMDELQLGQRILSQFANIDPVAIQTRGWQPHELRAYREARVRAREARLFIDETEGLDSATIRARATRFVSQNPAAALICVDYSALVADRDGDTDTARLGRISKRLRGIARALRLPLLAICQLNREPEKRGGGRPGLTDIRSSDEFAQDAGAVWLLHQPTDSDGNKIEDRLILTVSKNRHGARNKDIPLFYNRATGRIGGME